MPQQLFSNNASSTVASAVGTGDTAINLATGTGALFASPDTFYNEFQMVTLENPTTFAREIVKVTERGGDVLTVVRAQEGTTAQAWPAGTVVEARLTKKSVGRLLQNLAEGVGSAPGGIYVGEALNTYDYFVNGTLTATSVVTRGDSYILGDYTFITVVSGTAASPLFDPTTSNASFNGQAAYQTGSAVFLRLGLTADVFAGGFRPLAVGVGALAGPTAVSMGNAAGAAGQNSVAVGPFALSILANAVAQGYGALSLNGPAVGYRAIALNLDAASFGYEAGKFGNGFGSVNMGKEASTWGGFTVAMGYQAHAEREGFANITGMLGLGRDINTNRMGAYLNCGAEVIITTPFVELGTPVAWQANTAYTDGFVVQPTTPNGLQYRLVIAKENYTDALPNMATSGSTEPTWPSFYTETVAANDKGDLWVASNMLSEGIDELLPPYVSFFPTEVGFMCLTRTGITAVPNVSIGTISAPTRFVNNQSLSDITAAGQRHTFTGIKTRAQDNLHVTINSLATGTNPKFTGRFYFKGILVAEPG